MKHRVEIFYDFKYKEIYLHLVSFIYNPKVLTCKFSRCNSFFVLSFGVLNS